MANYVVISHGGRDVGTKLGTYVVPKGVNIFFFTEDEQLLNAGADLIEDALLTPNPDELGVQSVAAEKFSEYETLPNYTATGASTGGAFRHPPGVYLVGQSSDAGPVIPMPRGVKKRLSDIIGGASTGGVLGNNIYWLACRAAPINANRETRKAVTYLNDLPLARQRLGMPSGLKPSEVKRRGGKWQ